MDAQAVPIPEHEDVKNVFALYQQNGMGQEKADADSLVRHIAFMESQFEKVFNELQNVRSQLQTIQDKSIRATVTRIADAVDTKITEAKAQFAGIKDSVLQSFSNTVQAVKEKGVFALKRTADFLKIHSALSVLKNKLDGAVASLRRGVCQIEQMKTELHAARTHLGTAGRLMMKKDVKEAAAYDSKRGVLAGIQTIMNKTGGLLAGIGKATDSAMRKIEGLDHRGEKSSVRQTLREIKSVHAGGSPARPERDTAR